MKIDEKLWTCTKFSLLFWAEKRMLSRENRGVRRVIRCVLQPENGKIGRVEWKRKPPAPSGAGGAACQKASQSCVPRTARNQFKSVFCRDMCALQRGFSCPLRGNSPSGRKLFARSGNRRSAASGGNSKSVSRKRHDWRACKGAGIVVPQRCKVELSAFSGQPRHRTQRNLLKKVALPLF